MFDKVRIIESESLEPYYNLAVERTLMDMSCENELILYLWQNDKTVVIGRYQNAYLDVNIKKLYDDGGVLARRLTGGGAVYHDIGNLNFSFVTGVKSYNVNEDNDIIIGAVKRLGFNAEVNGRNDIVIDGRKFSGNAYLKNENKALHHGTLLISVDTDKMIKYLNVNADKLAGKGVKSVRSRVVNIGDIGKNIGINDIKSAIIAELKDKYNNIEFLRKDSIAENEVAKYKDIISNPTFIFGSNVRLNNNKYRKFSWGYADVSFTINNGVISDIEICTDSLYTAEIASAKEELKNMSIFDTKQLSSIAKDILQLINE